jgi:hypothetical protein
MSRYVAEGIATLISNYIFPRLGRWYKIVREGSRTSATMRNQAPRSRRVD